MYRAAGDEHRYRVVVNLGHADGARRRVVRVLNNASLADAERTRTTLLADRNAGRRRAHPRGGAQTVSEWMAYWLETYKRPRIQATTHERYEEIIRCQIVPRLGRIRISRLTPDDVQEFYNTLGHLAGQSQVQTAALLKAALAQALRSGHIASNPATAVDNPRHGPRTRRNLPTTEEVRALLRSMAKRHADGYEIIRFALETGMRLGEVSALEWSAIDLDSGTAHVHRTTVKIPNPEGTGRVRVFRQRTKTPASEAGVMLSPSTVAWLRVYRRDLMRARTALSPDYWTDDDGNLVFPCRRPQGGRKAGRAWDGAALRKTLRRYCRRLGIPVMNFHDTRRLFVSAAAQRVPLITVRDMARHADLDVTANVYARASEDDLRAGALAIDGIWATE